MPALCAIVVGVFVIARVGESLLSTQLPPTSSRCTSGGRSPPWRGVDGRAIDWLPLGGPSDLPCFVEHFNSDPLVKVLSDGSRIGRGGASTNVAYADARRAMAARVRMETPVLYFYSNRDTTVRVRVRFHRGLMTEWYPPAVVSQGAVSAATLRNPNQSSVIEWPSVRVTPTAPPAFPLERGESRYYAARSTDAAPLSVGDQHERFLFYEEWRISTRR